MTFARRQRALLAAALLLLAGACQQPPADHPADTPPAGNESPTGEAALPGSRGPIASRTDFGYFIAEPLVYESAGTRLATFNVEFLFDGEDPEGQANFPWKEDPEAARNHRDGVAAIIRTIDADVIMLQEVENREVLEMMIAESLQDMGYQAHFVQGRDTFTRQNVALLSRLPIDEVGRTDERAPVEGERSDYGVSKNLWARLDLGGTPTTLIGMHLLAQASNPDRAPRREAQARVLRDLAEREFASGRQVIVLGDLNDHDGQHEDRRGNVPVSRVLDIIKEAGPGLDNVMREVPVADRFTNFWDRNRDGEVNAGELAAIDHILLPPHFFDVPKEVRFVHAHDPVHGPDHFPIVVTLGL